MKKMFFLLAFIWGQVVCYAQNDFLAEYERFKQQAHQTYRDFRSQCNKEYAEFLRQAWEYYNTLPAISKPEDESVPPVVVPEDDGLPVNTDPQPVPYEEIIPVPQPEPQPSPIEPIEEIPAPPVAPAPSVVTFSFFGTTEEVRWNNEKSIKLAAISAEALADAWILLSDDSCTNLIYDCLKIREKRGLCDWAYLMMLRNMADTICGKNTNESILLTAYIYCQSGYQMRLAIAGNKLLMLVGTKHVIYERQYYALDGENFYPFFLNNEEIPERVQICGASFPQEKSMSLFITRAQDFAMNHSGERTISSDRYPEVSVTVKVNHNLISFFGTYPSSMIDDNVMTRWAMYANTPMAKDVAKQIYPQLQTVIAGKSQLEAANILLNWVQTGLIYEYDDKVWGGDRAFFAEESLNYPYCDCEDRSILFTRLVRDLLGLKCILVFYPGHLAAAVCFTDTVNGDYIQLNGQKYIVTDPTYIGAPVGMTMPKMDNQTAKVILLE